MLCVDGLKISKPWIALAVAVCALQWDAWSPAADQPTTQPALSFTSSAFGNNFAANAAELELRIAGGATATAGQIRITDELGRPVQQLAIEAGRSSVIVPLKQKGYYNVEAKATLSDGKQVEARTTASVVGPLLPNDLRLASPFGFFSVKGDTPLPIVAGGGWNRLFIPLNGVTRESNGDLRWWRPNAPGPKMPESVNGEPAPLRWVGVFMFPPASLIAPEHREKHNNHNVYPPVDWDGFRQSVEFAARHYAHWVDYFEPINEPDANWRGTEEELVRYHKVIAEAVHAVDPKLKVVGPCLCQVDIPRLRKLASLGLFDHIDGLSIHTYANDAPPEGKWWSDVQELRAFLRSIGKEEMPIVVSEYGWQTAAGDWARPVDRISQARYASRSLTLLAAQQVDAINYFCLRYEDPRIPHVEGWSVIEHDNAPRPSFAALSNVFRWLAGVEGRGTVLRPAPDTYLVLFKKGQGSVAVAWTTRGESTWQIPGRFGRVNDMMGRDVVPGANQLVTLTESPTFIELADASLPGIQVGEGVGVVRGGEVALPGEWAGASLPAPLSLSGNRVAVPTEAPAGDYLVMAKSSSGTWTAAPVKVLPQFAVESSEVILAGEDRSAVARMRVRSHGGAIDLLPIVRLAGAAPRFGERVKIPAGGEAVVDVALDNIPLGRRWTGVAAVEGRVGGNVESAEAPIDITVVPGGYVRDPNAPIDWSAVPKVRSQGWAPFGSTSLDTPPLSPDDCSAVLQWAWSERGLHFHIEVTDNDHVQDREPAQLWQQDSLQFSFDVDADKPWQMNVNNDVVGLNGHRIFEYGVAMRDGRPQTARWRESIVALPDDAPPIDAKVSRQGTVTIYDITFPWKTLGLGTAPAPGTSIGFDLLVNDQDLPPSRRHGLEIFGAINASKDPERLGRLQLQAGK